MVIDNKLFFPLYSTDEQHECDECTAQAWIGMEGPEGGTEENNKFYCVNCFGIKYLCIMRMFDYIKAFDQALQMLHDQGEDVNVKPMEEIIKEKKQADQFKPSGKYIMPEVTTKQ